MGMLDVISPRWETIDLSDWWMYEGYKIGLAEYCPSLRLVHFIAAYSSTDNSLPGIPNVSIHIKPPEKYTPVNNWLGLVFLSYSPDAAASKTVAVSQWSPGKGILILYSVDTLAYRIFMDLCYRI